MSPCTLEKNPKMSCDICDFLKDALLLVSWVSAFCINAIFKSSCFATQSHPFWHKDLSL